MKDLSPELKTRLLFLVHRGYVEIRLLLGLGKAQQAMELADTLELIPGMINNWQNGDLDKITSYLTIYQNKYKNQYGYNFMERLLEKDVPEF